MTDMTKINPSQEMLALAALLVIASLLITGACMGDAWPAFGAGIISGMMILKLLSVINFSRDNKAT